MDLTGFATLLLWYWEASSKYVTYSEDIKIYSDDIDKPYGVMDIKTFCYTMMSKHFILLMVMTFKGYLTVL